MKRSPILLQARSPTSTSNLQCSSSIHALLLFMCRLSSSGPSRSFSWPTYVRSMAIFPLAGRGPRHARGTVRRFTFMFVDFLVAVMFYFQYWPQSCSDERQSEGRDSIGLKSLGVAHRLLFSLPIQKGQMSRRSRTGSLTRHGATLCWTDASQDADAVRSSTKASWTRCVY